MRILIRVDASLEIGNGHVTRCLTIAHALKSAGAQCEFVCRLHKGHLLAHVEQQGFVAHALPEGHLQTWLGVSWQEDAKQTRQIINSQPYDWLIVDHYGLDANWELALRDIAKQQMAVDDLANRPHAVDVVWDQNLGRKPSDYAPWVARSCEVHVGASRALLRPEFLALRAESFQRLERKTLRHLLVSMGGVDKPNLTGRILQALKCMPLVLERACTITVVMGQHAPNLDQVKGIAAAMPWHTEVCVNVNDMARRILQADIAIGAMGTTAWERCCLGLPTLGLIQADNQMAGALHLEKAGAVWMIPTDGNLNSVLEEKLVQLQRPAALRAAQQASYQVTDGQGISRLLQRLQVHSDPLSSERIRPMQEQDLPTVLKWRNHPKVKQYMRNSHEICEEEHRTWFANASKDENRALLIYEDKGEPVGFVQFTTRSNVRGAEWGFYLSPQAISGTGRSMGAAALYYGFARMGVEKIVGEVMPKNEASIRFHERLGFSRVMDEKLPSYMHFFELAFDDWLAIYQKQEAKNE